MPTGEELSDQGDSTGVLGGFDYSSEAGCASWARFFSLWLRVPSSVISKRIFCAAMFAHSSRLRLREPCPSLSPVKSARWSHTGSEPPLADSTAAIGNQVTKVTLNDNAFSISTLHLRLQRAAQAGLGVRYLWKAKKWRNASWPKETI